MTIFKQVPIEEELPPKDGYYFTLKNGDEYTSKYEASDITGKNTFKDEFNVTHWLKEITLPTEEEIRKHFNKETPHDCVFDIDYLMKGAEYILNILNQKK